MLLILLLVLIFWSDVRVRAHELVGEVGADSMPSVTETA